MSTTVSAADRVAVERWAGEARVNDVRLLALVAFYGYHLLEVAASGDDPAYTPDYRAAVTLLALGWAGVVVLVHAWLRQGRAAPALHYLTVLADAGLVTALVTVSGGPKSPLVALYLLVVASAPLRLSLRVVYAATAAAVLGYLAALGHYVFVRVGVTAYYADPAVRVSRPQEVVLVLVLLTAGLLAGQAVRQARRLAAEPIPEVGP
jgi:hypothetical protein